VPEYLVPLGGSSFTVPTSPCLGALTVAGAVMVVLQQFGKGVGVINKVREEHG